MKIGTNKQVVKFVSYVRRQTECTLHFNIWYVGIESALGYR